MAHPSSTDPPSPTAAPDLDRAVRTLADQAQAFARMPPAEKASLLRSVLPRLLSVAHEQVRLSCNAKAIDPASPTSAEEWFAGPYVTLTNVRLLGEALDDIAKGGRPLLPRRAVRTRPDGRVEVDVFPHHAKDKMLYGNIRAYCLLTADATKDSVTESQARFYQQRDPEGKVCLILGAGNVASIPPMDTLYKLFVEGHVVLLKMSPVNAYLGPSYEHAFAPLIDRGFVQIVYGGAEVGTYLTGQTAIGDIHITGSAETHDRIVWGPPGPQQLERKAAHQPLWTKPITSELGNISPVLVVPSLYSEEELWFQVRSLVTQVVNNASFNCNAAKMLVLPKGFRQRPLLMTMLICALRAIPCRRAYYPGAHARHKALIEGRPPLDPQTLTQPSNAALPKGVSLIGDSTADTLPWTIMTGLDEHDSSEQLFSTEPFCSILSVIEVGSSDPVDYLAQATGFCNERLWGTLNASLVVHPLAEEDPVVAQAVDQALVDLRYGSIAINQWPAMVYATVVPPWGGHPSATLSDVQSGIGFVHNTWMLGQIEKTIMRAPLRAFPKPAIFYDHRRAQLVGQRLAGYAAEPTWSKVFGLATAAMFG